MCPQPPLQPLQQEATPQGRQSRAGQNRGDTEPPIPATPSPGGVPEASSTPRAAGRPGTLLQLLPPWAPAASHYPKCKQPGAACFPDSGAFLVFGVVPSAGEGAGAAARLSSPSANASNRWGLGCRSAA